MWVERKRERERDGWWRRENERGMVREGELYIEREIETAGAGYREMYRAR